MTLEGGKMGAWWARRRELHAAWRRLPFGRRYALGQGRVPKGREEARAVATRLLWTRSRAGWTEMAASSLVLVAIVVGFAFVDPSSLVPGLVSAAVYTVVFVARQAWWNSTMAERTADVDLDAPEEPRPYDLRRGGGVGPSR